MKIIMLKGLPGSGKTTWAMKEVLKPNHIRVNKDELRVMLHGGKYTKDNENEILFVRDKIINMGLEADKTVIVDDTNFSAIHIERLQMIATSLCADFVIKDFTHIPLETCIKNDLKRSNSVGEKVIKNLYTIYIEQKPERPRTAPYNPKLNNCIIVDIDGTIALMNGRSPFDWNRVNEDLPNKHVIEIIHSYILSKLNSIDDKVFFVTGRDEICRDATLGWIAQYMNFIAADGLLMRPSNNTESDETIKKYLYKEHIENQYNVLVVFDDRNKVVDMWRSLGFTCLQVADGNF